MSEDVKVYPLGEVTPPEPTPEELAAAARDKAWNDVCDLALGLRDGGKVHDTELNRKLFDCIYDAALAAAKK